jgi:hypothetical protein
MAAYLTWLKQHRGATDETIRRYRTDITPHSPSKSLISLS